MVVGCAVVTILDGAEAATLNKTDANKTAVSVAAASLVPDEFAMIKFSGRFC